MLSSGAPRVKKEAPGLGDEVELAALIVAMQVILLGIVSSRVGVRSGRLVGLSVMIVVRLVTLVGIVLIRRRLLLLVVIWLVIIAERLDTCQGIVARLISALCVTSSPCLKGLSKQRYY